MTLDYKTSNCNSVIIVSCFVSVVANIILFLMIMIKPPSIAPTTSSVAGKFVAWQNVVHVLKPERKMIVLHAYRDSDVYQVKYVDIQGDFKIINVQESELLPAD